MRAHVRTEQTPVHVRAQLCAGVYKRERIHTHTNIECRVRLIPRSVQSSEKVTGFPTNSAGP